MAGNLANARLRHKRPPRTPRPDLRPQRPPNISRYGLRPPLQKRAAWWPLRARNAARRRGRRRPTRAPLLPQLRRVTGGGGRASRRGYVGRLLHRSAGGLDDELVDRRGERSADDRADDVRQRVGEVVSDERGAEPACWVE